LGLKTPTLLLLLYNFHSLSYLLSLLLPSITSSHNLINLNSSQGEFSFAYWPILFSAAPVLGFYSKNKPGKFDFDCFLSHVGRIFVFADWQLVFLRIGHLLRFLPKITTFCIHILSFCRILERKSASFASLIKSIEVYYQHEPQNRKSAFWSLLLPPLERFNEFCILL